MIKTFKKHPLYTALAATVAVYAALGFLLAPWLLEKNAVEIVQRDFGADLRVERIEVNPFLLSLRINGLELDDPKGQPTARIEEIFANFQLSSIYRLALTFDEVRITSPELFVARDRAGELNFAYLLNTAAGEVDSEGEGADQAETSLFPLLVHNFIIDDSYINWSDAIPVEPVDARFGPIAIDIKELNTLPDRAGQQTVEITTETTGTLSWSGDLQLNPLRSAGHASLKGARFPLVSAYLRHQAGLDIVGGHADIDLDYEVSTTDAGQLQASVSSFALAITDIVVNSFADGTGIDFAGEDQQILQVAQIRLADGRFDWPQQTLSLGSIAIDSPQIDLARDANGVFSIEPRQTANDEPAGVAVDPGNDPLAADQPWQFAVGNFAVNGLVLNLLDRGVTPEAKLGISDFNLSISDISNQPGQRFATTLSLALSGGRVALSGNLSVLPEPLFEFDVKFDAVQLAGAQPYIRQQANLSMDSGALNLDGRVSRSASEPLLFNGDLEIADLSISESIDDARLASWQSFRADNIAFSQSELRLDISRLHFDKLYGDILIDKDGRLNLGQIDKSADNVAQPEVVERGADADSATEDAALKIRIGDIVLANASADFSDLSLPLPFAVKIDALNGKLTTISTESRDPSEVTLEGKVDEFGLARVSGHVTPLQPSKNTNLLVAFENIDLPKFTPYSIPFAGRKVDSGRLDLKLGYEVKDNQLVGENSIVLRDFELGEKVPHPDALDLPLGLAVALLKDASGKIDIDLPVRGNLDDPEFSFGDVILGTLGNLLTRIVLSPFSALGSLLGIEASELENVKFAAGRHELSPPEQEKAIKLAEALAQRPELQLGIAGVVDPQADGLALRSAQLDGLLEQRIKQIADSDPASQYADQRRTALEQLFGEQRGAEAASQALEDLRQQLTTLVEVEGQAEPVPSLDKLAYANALRARLVDLQAIDEADLNALASARAAALATAMTTIDAGLQARIAIHDNVTVTREAGESIAMKVTLGSVAN